jgi:hypothetical protein
MRGRRGGRSGNQGRAEEFVEAAWGDRKGWMQFPNHGLCLFVLVLIASGLAARSRLLMHRVFYPVAMKYSNGNNCCGKNLNDLKMVFLVQLKILFGFL